MKIEKKNLCECGCGEKCNNRFVNGHSTAGRFKKGNVPWNLDENHPKYKGYIELVTKLCKETKGKISLRKGITMREEYGEERAKQINEKNRINHLGKKISEETKDLWSKQRKGVLKSETCKKNISNGHKLLWSNKEFVEERLKSLLKRPTSYEKKISEICIENNLPFVYTGNGTFLIGHKNPDFINEKDKIAIEVYYSYFKIKKYGSIDNYERQRSEYFSKYGYKTIFIRDAEINSKSWKEICLNKINEKLK